MIADVLLNLLNELVVGRICEKIVQFMIKA